MRNIISFCKQFMLLVAFFFMPLMANAAIWHISTTAADDSADCTDALTPCKTLAGVLAKGTLASGDSIYIAEGTYDNTSSCQIYIKKPVEIYGGYSEDFTTRTSDPSKTLLTDTRTGSTVCRLFAISSGHTGYVVFDGLSMSGVVDAGSHAGTILTYDNTPTSYAGAWIQLNNVIVSGNTASGNGAIYSSIAGDRLEITNSSISNNVSRGGNGAGIYMIANSRLTVENSIIDNNSAAGTGAGAYLNAGVKANFTNTTFFNNTASSSAGAVYLTGTDAEFNCTHCSIVGNSAGNTYESIQAASGGSVYLKNSVVSNATDVGNTVRIEAGASFSDGGYNAWGLNGADGFSGVTAPLDRGNRVNTEPALTDLFEADIAFNGGDLKSLKPVSSSALIDAIPNDAAGLQVGLTPSNPFTSITQANSGIKYYDAYSAGEYYFKINGLAFKTYVDDEGFVLIASSSKVGTPIALTQDTNINLQSDEILTDVILAELDIDEVKITSPGSKLGDYDMRTTNSTIIAEIKANQTLSNNFDLGKSVWWGTHEANMSNATCTEFGKGYGDNLDQNIIGHCGDGTQGFHWQGNRGYETVTWADSANDDMNLWVRATSVGNCDGVVGTDQRGLQRPDFVNYDDPNQYGDISDCDIGSFEWNDGYKLDCHDEDGMRPEWNILSPSAGFCISNPNDLSPKALINSIGMVNWLGLVMLGLLPIFRYRRVIVDRI